MVAHVLDRVYRQSNPFIENLYSMSNVTDLIHILKNNYVDKFCI